MAGHSTQSYHVNAGIQMNLVGILACDKVWQSKRSLQCSNCMQRMTALDRLLHDGAYKSAAGELQYQICTSSAVGDGVSGC